MGCALGLVSVGTIWPHIIDTVENTIIQKTGVHEW